MSDFSDKIALLDALAAARTNLLYWQSKAAEAGDKSGAAALAAKGQALKDRIADLRATAGQEWAEKTAPLAGEFQKASEALRVLASEDEKRRRIADGVGRALASVDDVLKALGKVFP